MVLCLNSAILKGYNTATEQSEVGNCKTVSACYNTQNTAMEYCFYTILKCANSERVQSTEQGPLLMKLAAAIEFLQAAAGAAIPRSVRCRNWSQPGPESDIM